MDRDSGANSLSVVNGKAQPFVNPDVLGEALVQPNACSAEIANYVLSVRYLWSLNRLSWVMPRRLMGVWDFIPPCGRRQL